MEANIIYLLGASKAMAMRCLWIFLAGTLILQRFAGSVSTPASTCDSPTKLYAQDLKLGRYTDDGPRPGYFRYLSVDVESGYLFVGAMNHIHALSLSNIENTAKRFKQDFMAKPPSHYQCKIQGKSDFPDCQNHVRVLVRNTSMPNTFYMCSTGAYQPMAYLLKLETKRFRLLAEDSENAVGICPYDPADNTTAIIVEHGNPGGIPALYAGGYTDFIKADPIILRPDLYHMNRTLEVRFVRTLRDRSKWLNEPQFVGSFELDGYVYFFLREVALEYTNCGKKIYSRVVRICKNDQGGKFILRNVWTSFIKARLNCSIPGEYPYYFDEIQDVYLVGETFYGLFTTNINGLTASAICAFTVHDMNKAFWGPFKGQVTKTSNWLPIPESEVPNPRPGNCTATDAQALSSQAVTDFVSRSELLMDQAVSSQYSHPIFYQGNCLMQKLAVAKNVSGNGDLVFFTASNTGLVYKIFAWPSKSPLDTPKSYVTTTYVPFEDMQPVWSMILHEQTLFLGTDTSVTQLSIVTCEAYHKIDLCIYDPYCGWDLNTNKCTHLVRGKKLITFDDIDLSDYSLEKAIQLRVGELYRYEKVSKISGSSVTLKVEYKLHVPGSVMWLQNNTHIADDRHILAQDNSLIITDLRKLDEGIYEAIDEQKRTVAKYLLSVETTKEQIEQRWMRKFDEWCDEFERYQNDIRQWEQKCSSCCQDHPISNMVPGIGGK